MKMSMLTLTEIGKMHTYIFRDFNDLRDPEGKHGCHFRPTKTHVSEKYGRHFFIDIGMHFVSAPSLEKGGYDETQLDYVGSWSDLEGVVLQDLFDIYQSLIYEYHMEEIDAERANYYELEEAVEKGEITYL